MKDITLEKERIVKEAKDSYQRNFSENQYIPTEQYSQQDIILDKEKLEKQTFQMKEAKERQQKSLEVLRHQIIKEAENSLEKTFVETKEEKPHKRLNTEEMYQQLCEEKIHLSQMVGKMKEERLAK